MSGDWKNILKKTLMGLLIAGVLTGAYLLGSSQRSKTRCSAIDVTIEDSLETRFVTEKAIREYLEDGCKDLTGMPLDSIDLHRIENILVSRSPILRCEAYVTTEGILKISVHQRKPSLVPLFGLFGYSLSRLLGKVNDFLSAQRQKGYGRMIRTLFFL